MEAEDPLASQRSNRPPFFACYLLCSMSPRFKGCTYIGFTVNPRRRIRQHNGEITSGAWQTKKKRPWEMILCIYGFPSQVSALQFEWAWQHPNKSLAVREAAKGLRSLSGTGGKVMLAYTMLTLPEWKSLNLTVNFLSTKYINKTKGCPTLPPHMKVQISPLDELPCYTDNWVSDDEDDLAEDHCSNKSDVSDPEDKALNYKGTAHEKQPTGIKNQQEKENGTQVREKRRRRGRPRKKQKSSSLEDESDSEVLVPSTKEMSLSSLQTNGNIMSERRNKLDTLSAKPDSLLQISDSEDSEDNFGGDQINISIRTRDSFRIPNSSSTTNHTNHRQEMTYSMEDDWSINFRPDCGVAIGSEYDKIEDILDNVSIRRRMSVEEETSEFNMSRDFSIECNLVKDNEADQVTDNVDNSINNKMGASSGPSEFPSFQKYSPLCCISPLKIPEESPYSYITPCKSSPIGKPMNLNYSFLSPVASQCPIIIISSTPRPVSRRIIDLTDSPLT